MRFSQWSCCFQNVMLHCWTSSFYVSHCSTFCIRLEQPKKTVSSKHHKWLAQWHYNTAQMTCIFKTNLPQNFKTADYQLSTALNIIIFILNKNQLNSVRLTGSVQCLIHLTRPFGCCTIISKPSKEKFQLISHIFPVVFAFGYFTWTFRHSLRTKTGMSMCTTCLCVPHAYVHHMSISLISPSVALYQQLHCLLKF